MECDQNPNVLDEINVICGHRVCQTRDAKWLCFEEAYQKFHRPHFYDIGGTYIEDVADYWFLCKIERIGDNFLFHVFISNHQEGSFTVALSCDNEILVDKKNGAFLSSVLKEYKFDNVKERNQIYITTYHFTEIDIALLKDKKLYIAINFPCTPTYGSKDNRNITDYVKANHDFGALLTDPIGSDFTIESADGEKFNVHKVLLVAHSEVFKAMLKEETAESQNNYVKLVDVGKEDLTCILEFIYTGTVKDLENCNCFNLLMLADKYDLKGLRALSQYVLSQQLNTDNALEVLMVADMYNSKYLKTTALKFIKKNISILQSDTFKEIRNADLLRELCTFLLPYE